VKYQLVLQFRTSTSSDFDDLISLENSLIEILPLTAEFDGHDFGSNEFNIFILTGQPKETFRECAEVIEQHRSQRPFKAAYRKFEKDKFVALWPPTLKNSTIA
jgi:hypothetical protein